MKNKINIKGAHIDVLEKKKKIIGDFQRTEKEIHNTT